MEEYLIALKDILVISIPIIVAFISYKGSKKSQKDIKLEVERITKEKEAETKQLLEKISAELESQKQLLSWQNSLPQTNEYTTLWPYDEVGSNTEAKNELKKIFGGSVPFDTPKPVRLIDRILHIAADSDSVILDSFAGSASTAHAVLEANRADDGNRKFILIEMMDYAESLTAERTRRVISGYTSSDDVEEPVYDVELTLDNLADGSELLTAAKTAAKGAKKRYDKVSKPKIVDGHLLVIGTKRSSEEVTGTGGSFSYYELGESLMVSDVLNENVGIDKIREYVYFTDTKSCLPEAHLDEPYYMGIHMNSAYYFYYEKQAVTTLNREFLHTVKTKADAYVIYADLCTLSDAELEKYHITFKKIPRDITKL